MNTRVGKMMPKKAEKTIKIIGFQVVDPHGGIFPGYHTHTVLSLEIALQDQQTSPTIWLLKPIREGEIESPTMIR